MTLILPKQPHVHDILTGNSNTIGLRIPDNAIAQQVLEQFGALATPSANSSGQLSPTTAAHVQHDLGDQVDLILDGGICSLGMESTLIDCTGKQPKIRRQGFLTAEDITQATGLTTTQALSAAEKRLQYPVTSTSFAAIQEQLKTDTTAIVVVSRHKPTCRDVVLHDARVPHRLTTPVKTTAHRHWILMPQDATGFAHSFYEQLHYANTLLQGNAQGRIVVESLPNDHFIWRTLAMRLNSFLLASTDLN